MSSSDSDFSIDWFSSDDDESDDETKNHETSSSSSSSSSSGCSAAQRNVKDDVQRFTSVCSQLPVEANHRPDRKWKHDEESDRKWKHDEESDRKWKHGEESDRKWKHKEESDRKRKHIEEPDRKWKDDEESDHRSDTQNQLFLHKCLELQSFVQPLNSILQNLRSGRYSQRLSRFQENVAVDRIQRILGVLQNPEPGGRFLGIVLKIEEMLHNWFPHIKPNQTDDGSAAKRLKQRCHADVCPPSAVVSASSKSSTHLKWLHTSPVVSLKSVEALPGPPTASNQEVTQDATVSSSSDWTAPPPRRPLTNLCLRRGPPPFKISSPCLERLLQATESIIAPRTAGGGGVLS